jgi:hypothetical protein
LHLDRLPLLAALVAIALPLSACAPAESPARVELRHRLQQEARLSDAELGQLCDELARTVAGKTVRLVSPDGADRKAGVPEPDVFNMLRDRAGLYDEGLRRDGGKVFRILNGPGKSDNAEVEATERLWIEVDSFLPRRYEFTYAFRGYGDFAYDLTFGT